MSRLHFLIISMFTVALGTGIVVGMGMTRVPPHPHERGSWLADQLQLTPDQSEKIRTIWSDLLRKGGQHHMEAVRQYRKERDEALLALLTPEQKAAYQKINERFTEELGELNKQRDADFQAAAEKTKTILNAHQRQVYEELIKKGFHGGPFGPHDGGPGGPRPDHEHGWRQGHPGPGGPGGPPDRGPHGPASTTQPGAI